MASAPAVADRVHRSRRRYRRAALSLAVSLAAKGVALVTLFASVPPSIAYLGAERFGLWMTALSAAGLLSFANFAEAFGDADISGGFANSVCEKGLP